MLQILSASEQVAQHLRSEIVRVAWENFMPGSNMLSRNLGVGRKTVDEALLILEREGLLVSQGVGRRRRIDLSAVDLRIPSSRVRILLYDKLDRRVDYLVELIYLLKEAGHDAKFADKSMHDLGMDVGRIARFAASAETDAWIVASAPRDVLKWFEYQSIPTFALFGRMLKINLAHISPRRADTYVELIDQLVALGHKRVVNLVREDRRKPTPGFLERLFLEQLETQGVRVGHYNLPDWEDSPIGLQTLLNSMFRHTPPTAMLIDGPVLFNAVRCYLGNHGYSVPGQISLVCTEPDSTFEWCLPTVSHINWDSGRLVRRMVNWANNISRGKDDRRKTSLKARFVPGGTIGPA